MAAGMKKCPYCAEEILAEAIKCKHCGSDLTTSPAKAKKQAQKAAGQKTSPAALGCALMLLLFMGWCIYAVNSPPSRSGGGSGGGTSSGSTPTDIELTGSVSFTGTQFVIRNQDSFDWRNVEIELNYGLLSGWYKLTTGLMEAGESYTVGALQFAKSDGERFNPATTKPTKVMITADTPRGRGFYFGGWE